VNDRRILPLAVAKVIVPIRRLTPLLRARHYDRIAPDPDFSAAVGHFRNLIRLVAIASGTTFHWIPGVPLGGRNKRESYNRAHNFHVQIRGPLWIRSRAQRFVHPVATKREPPIIYSMAFHLSSKKH
jgi:hypothetical protein